MSYIAAESFEEGHEAFDIQDEERSRSFPPMEADSSPSAEPSITAEPEPSAETSKASGSLGLLHRNERGAKSVQKWGVAFTFGIMGMFREQSNSKCTAHLKY